MPRRTQRAPGRPGSALADRYPGIAIVAGASEGIGAAFARRLSAAGFELLLIARRPGPLRELADELSGPSGKSVRTLECDLAGPDAVEVVDAALDGARVGLLVYNAALAPVGGFESIGEDALDAVTRVNVRSPMLLIHRLVSRALGRNGADGRMGVIIVSSMSGWQGGPYLAAYAASKAFLRVLGEGLWHELREKNADVVVSVPGATNTPGYRARSSVKEGRPEAGAGKGPGVLSPDMVATAALRKLGRGPLSVPGVLYKISVVIMGRLLPRRWAVRIMGAAGRALSA